MNTKGNIERHSKIKLDIYKKYLEAYLAIMSVVPAFTDIFIIEPFAGKGIADNGEQGSALIAKDVIESIKQSVGKTKNIYLKLNEYDKVFFDELLNNLSPLNDYIEIVNKDANESLFNFLSILNPKWHRLLFIDPWGYTQLRKETYQKIFTQANLDLLIFVPIYQIYRFLRKEETDEQLKPIATFLNDFDISEAEAKKASNLGDFVNQIKDSISEKAATPFVYCKTLKNTKCNSEYALFFATQHILGAQKFLEALDKIKEKDLFEDIVSDNEEIFTEEVKKYFNGKPLNNIELYELGILNEFLPKRINLILKNLENKKEITVNVLDSSNRRKGIFYIGYNYYKEKPKVQIIFNGE